MELGDQQYLKELKYHFLVLGVVEKEDLKSLWKTWRRRYKHLSHQDSSDKQNFNDRLTEIENSYAYLKKINADELSQIVEIYHEFFFIK